MLGIAVVLFITIINVDMVLMIRRGNLVTE